MLFIYLSFIEDEADKELFVAVYEQYRDSMVRFVKSYTRRDDIAEDVVHDTFLKLAKSIHRWKKLDGAEQKAYILVAVRNQAITTLNKLRKEPKSYIPADTFYGDWIEAADQGGLLQNAAKLLPDSLVDVLILKYWYGYSNKEIGKILNIKPNAVSQRVARIKNILKTTYLGDDAK